MVLRAIVKFFTVAFRVVAKILTTLLYVLGLWVPALFCLLFVIVCAITNTSLTSAQSIFVIGLIVSFVLAVLLALYQNNRREAISRRAKNSVTRLSRDTETATPKRKKDKEKGNEKDSETLEGDEPTLGKKEWYSMTDSDRAKFATKYFDTARASEVKDELPEGLKETPLVFATRRDNSVFVYEFTDRLEFYHMEDSGKMKLINIVKKD